MSRSFRTSLHSLLCVLSFTMCARKACQYKHNEHRQHISREEFASLIRTLREGVRIPAIVHDRQTAAHAGVTCPLRLSADAMPQRQCRAGEADSYTSAKIGTRESNQIKHLKRALGNQPLSALELLQSVVSQLFVTSTRRMSRTFSVSEFVCFMRCRSTDHLAGQSWVPRRMPGAFFAQAFSSCPQWCES